ncbi:MAG: Zn-ribbon domain-containing OB-fold protein [Nitrososphaerota archaeon]|jgi:uncharacterized OB-fold protein|nr:Zn-ribbon domain-containing OB-fold protein [Nitrososphaerota archaeon]
MSSKVRSLPGTEITHEDLKSNRYSFYEYQAKLKYSYTSGVAITRFLEGLKQGEIWGRRCVKCGRVVVPPRMYCEFCFRPNDEWVRVKDTGRINTYSICWVNADASRRNTPITIAVVDLDGASPLMGILHYVDEIAPKKVKIGMRVKAVWKPPEERTGSILDIKYFRPLKE